MFAPASTTVIPARTTLERSAITSGCQSPDSIRLGVRTSASRSTQRGPTLVSTSTTRSGSSCCSIGARRSTAALIGSARDGRLRPEALDRPGEPVAEGHLGLEAEALAGAAHVEVALGLT